MLGRAEIAARIPHGGRMCLLDRVLEWDERAIRCAALSHRDADNPLREAGGLPVWAGIEYAAQAAAVHFVLVSGASAPRAGVLGMLRNVNAACDWLDQEEGELLVGATLLHSDPAGAIYRFTNHARGAGRADALLLDGQFTLMLSAAGGEASA